MFGFRVYGSGNLGRRLEWRNSLQIRALITVGQGNYSLSVDIADAAHLTNLIELLPCILHDLEPMK